MKNQVLSIEQMKHLQELGVDTSKAKKEYKQFLELNQKYHKIVHNYFEKEIAKGNEDLELNDVYFEEKSISLYTYDWSEDFHYIYNLNEEEMIKLGLLEETPNSEIVEQLVENGDLKGGNDEKRD